MFATNADLALVSPTSYNRLSAVTAKTTPELTMDKRKDFLRRFYRRNASSNVVPLEPRSPFRVSQLSIDQSSPQTNSFSSPNPSVEPPMIDRYLMYESPIHLPIHETIQDPNWLIMPGLTPPISRKPMNTPIMESPAEVSANQQRPDTLTPDLNIDAASSNAYDITRPTCSLNLVCYRGGREGCILRQVQTVLATRFAAKEQFETAIKNNPRLTTTDEAFFNEPRDLYADMSSFWRRYLSLKGLTGFRILSVNLN
jgi:hypothetical protein